MANIKLPKELLSMVIFGIKLRPYQDLSFQAKIEHEVILISGKTDVLR